MKFAPGFSQLRSDKMADKNIRDLEITHLKKCFNEHLKIVNDKFTSQQKNELWRKFWNELCKRTVIY